MIRSLTFISASLPPSTHNVLQGWSEADWAGNVDTRRATSRYIFQLDSSCLLSWQRKKQSVIAMFISEAEYISTAAIAKELIWLQALIQELGYFLKLSSILYCNNECCITLSENPKFHNPS